MSKKLTSEMIQMKCKTDRIGEIKNLNMWGNDLADVSIVKHMPMLEIISFSMNKISSLRDFSQCFNLRELYIRKNNIRDLSEIKYLSELPNLKTLWI